MLHRLLADRKETWPKMKNRRDSLEQLRAIPRSSTAADVPVCAPSVDELATVMAPESLLAIIWRRSYGVRLAPGRRSLDFDDDIPVWLFFALARHEREIVELMNHGFLATWVEDEADGLKAHWASLVPARHHGRRGK